MEFLFFPYITCYQYEHSVKNFAINVLHVSTYIEMEKLDFVQKLTVCQSQRILREKVIRSISAFDPSLNVIISYRRDTVIIVLYFI